MRIRTLLATLLALVLVAGACSDDDAQAAGDGTWPEKITFGFVPSSEQEKLQDDIQPFMDVLSNALGIEVEGVVTTDYTGLVTAMGTGTADLGAFGPFGYVLAQQQFGNMEVLIQAVRYGSPTYHGQWMTNDPSLCDMAPESGTALENSDDGVTQVGALDAVALQVGVYFGDSGKALGESVDAGDVSPGMSCMADLSKVKGKTVAFTSESSPPRQRPRDCHDKAENVDGAEGGDLIGQAQHVLPTPAQKREEAERAREQRIARFDVPLRLRLQEQRVVALSDEGIGGNVRHGPRHRPSGTALNGNPRPYGQASLWRRRGYPVTGVDPKRADGGTRSVVTEPEVRGGIGGHARVDFRGPPLMVRSTSGWRGDGRGRTGGRSSERRRKRAYRRIAARRHRRERPRGTRCGRSSHHGFGGAEVRGHMSRHGPLNFRGPDLMVRSTSGSRGDSTARVRGRSPDRR